MDMNQHAISLFKQLKFFNSFYFIYKTLYEEIVKIFERIFKYLYFLNWKDAQLYKMLFKLIEYPTLQIIATLFFIRTLTPIFRI